MKTFCIALLSISLSVAAQFALKAGMSSNEMKAVMMQSLTLHMIAIIFSNKFIIMGFVLYGIGAIIWLAVLADWGVSKAYPLVGIGFGLSVLIGFFAGEQVTLARVFGIILICSGVAIVAQN